MKEGIAMEKFEALADYETSPLFDEKERAALAFADRMTRTDADLDDATFARAAKHFSHEELVELAGVVALENFRSKFNNAFRVESQGFCVMREK